MREYLRGIKPSKRLRSRPRGRLQWVAHARARAQTGKVKRSVGGAAHSSRQLLGISSFNLTMNRRAERAQSQEFGSTSRRRNAMRSSKRRKAERSRQHGKLDLVVVVGTDFVIVLWTETSTSQLESRARRAPQRTSSLSWALSSQPPRCACNHDSLSNQSQEIKDCALASSIELGDGAVLIFPATSSRMRTMSRRAELTSRDRIDRRWRCRDCSRLGTLHNQQELSANGSCSCAGNLI